MRHYGFLIINWLFLSVTVGDPDLFPTRSDCSNINCGVANNTGHVCCTDRNQENSGKDDESTMSAIIFFAAVIGSLITIIALMLLCINCKNMCMRLKDRTSDLGRSTSVNTVSAGVQTNPSDLPPPYAVQDVYHDSNQYGGVAELHIPRCPSYVMNPPKYQEVISTDEHVNVEHITDDTTIEFSINSDVVA